VTPADVLARHIEVPSTFLDQTCCGECGPYMEWPCDAVDQARQFQAAQERVARLEAALRDVMPAAPALRVAEGRMFDAFARARAALAQPAEPAR